MKLTFRNSSDSIKLRVGMACAKSAFVRLSSNKGFSLSRYKLDRLSAGLVSGRREVSANEFLREVRSNIRTAA